MNANTLDLVLTAQRNELTEYHIYTALAASSPDSHNRELLARIAADELAHHDFFARISGREVKPRRLVVLIYVVLCRVLGITFALKLMERGEETAQVGYQELADIEGVDQIITDEEEHEHQLLAMLRDDRLEYAGSMVLGLNDALVELTGALAGMTLALAEARVVAAAGLVTGIAASLSMASSEYLASKSEGHGATTKNPIKAAAYTGSAYIFAVVLLILPFFLAANLYLALAITLAVAIVIIAVFTAYLSVARDLPFGPRFLEMAGISLGVAAISFAVGWLVRSILGIGV